MIKDQFCGKVGNFGGKNPHFLGRLQKFSPLRTRNFEKVHCKDMIFHRNSLHCKGSIRKQKFVRSSAPPRVRISSDAQKNVKSFLVSSSFKKLIIPFAFAANNPTWNKKLKHDFLEKRHQLINIETNHTAKMKSFDVFSDFLFQIKKVTSST